MAKRFFEAKVRVVVENDEVTNKRDMKFKTDELASHLEEFVVLDLDTEESGSEVTEGNAITSVEVDWDSLTEIREKR